MNSRDAAYDEDMILARVIEESKTENKVSSTGRQRRKRAGSGSPDECVNPQEKEKNLSMFVWLTCLVGQRTINEEELQSRKKVVNRAPPLAQEMRLRIPARLQGNLVTIPSRIRINPARKGLLEMQPRARRIMIRARKQRKKVIASIRVYSVVSFDVV